MGSCTLHSEQASYGGGGGGERGRRCSSDSNRGLYLEIGGREDQGMSNISYELTGEDFTVFFFFL